MSLTYIHHPRRWLLVLLERGLGKTKKMVCLYLDGGGMGGHWAKYRQK